MDQLKVFWAGVVKFHFWILTVIVLISSLVAFNFSRSTLDENVSTRISQLNNGFTTVTKLANDAPTHPNALSEKGMDTILNSIKTNVADAWSKQYDLQKAILSWDNRVVMDRETFRKLDGYRPIETNLEFPLPKDPIPVTHREAYRNYINTVFPDLVNTIGAKWTAKAGTSAISSEDSETSGSIGIDTSGALVKWESSSQMELQSYIVPWGGRTEPPSTLDICYTQENIWILKGILEVIKKTNGKAKENFQAPIKKVEWIRIGKEAGSGASSLVASGGADGDDGGSSADAVGDGAVFGAQSDPADMRYVDENYKPVAATILRQKMKSDDAFYAVAKRIPVRFKVKMDQSKIAKLLAECSNGNIMIEVKQVRINAEGASGIAIGGAMGLDGMPMASMEGGDFEGSSETAAVTFTSVTPDPPVEIYGIVYLFNPVDFAKIGLEKVTETSPATAVVGPPTVTPTVAPTVTPVAAPVPASTAPVAAGPES
ncbi:MAG: hypothetical protein SGI77_19210 [Pirellulaceae bacterium]|nr:hypothetical protein [Pirellulaceae bacterium]